jgi:hypothetical protein
MGYIISDVTGKYDGKYVRDFKVEFDVVRDSRSGETVN